MFIIVLIIISISIGKSYEYLNNSCKMVCLQNNCKYSVPIRSVNQECYCKFCVEIVCKDSKCKEIRIPKIIKEKPFYKINFNNHPKHNLIMDNNELGIKGDLYWNLM
tara:strand:- start:7043 stop:7363 length:321 start_codon:yes stop_codon:yes gene_type:complete